MIYELQFNYRKSNKIEYIDKLTEIWVLEDLPDFKL